MIELQSFPSRSYADLVVDDLGEADDRPPLILLHGLTFDRTMWRPALMELETLDPGRRVLAFDLPGHGESPDATSYAAAAIVEQLHTAILEANLDAPVIVGHSGAASAAGLYAAQYATRGVITVEGTILAAGFAGMLQSLEPVLRGPGFADAWSGIAARAFRLEEVDADVRDFVVATSRARQAVVLGYWQELFELTPAEIDAWITASVVAVRAAGIPYVSVLGSDPSAAEVAWLATNLPRARIEVWLRSGHFPQLAHPRRFAELLASTSTWAAGETDEPRVAVAPN